MARRRNDRPYDLWNVDPRPVIAAFRRLDRRAQVVVVCVLAIVGLVALVAYVAAQRHRPGGPQASTQPSPGPTTPGQAPPGTSPGGPPPAGRPPGDPAENLLLGNPSGATPDPANRDNYLMVKPYYTLSYNDANGTPNWVSWRVTAGDLGTAERKRAFDADNALPWGFKTVTTADYKDTGFDRGHMCPHSDRAADKNMSFATFVMTNIIPQSPNVNQKAWRELEDYGRELVVKQRVRLYTVCGPAGRGGRGRLGPAEAVGKPDATSPGGGGAGGGGKGRVVVPAECWKVIVVVPETGGPGDPAAVTAAARVIAVVMPNDEARVTNDEWTPYRTTVAEVERRTGYRFFDRLRPEVAEALRRKVDDAYVAPPKPHPQLGRRPAED